MRGFQLLEVIVATCVLSLALFFCLAVLPVSWRSVRSCDHQNAANALAQEIFDHCAAGPFARLTPGLHTGGSGDALSPYLVDVELEDHVRLHCQLRIATGSGATAARLRLLDLQIDWEEQNRSKRLERHRRIAQIRR